MQQYQRVYLWASDLGDSRWILALMLPSKQLAVYWCCCMMTQDLPNKSVNPIRIVLHRLECENHSIAHRLKLYTRDPYVVALIHAMHHHPHDAVMHELLQRPNRDRHEYKCDHLTIPQQINPTTCRKKKSERNKQTNKQTENQTRNMKKCFILLHTLMTFFFSISRFESRWWRMKEGVLSCDFFTPFLLTFPGLDAVVSKMSPLGSFVLNLNEIMLCLPVSQGGNI